MVRHQTSSASAATEDRPIEYGEHAGENAPRARAKDRYGNAEGAEYDLARDGAFNGKKVTVLHLYQGEGFDFSEPKAALKQKGFKVSRLGAVPSAQELERELADASQLWVISSPGAGGGVGYGYEMLLRQMGRGGHGELPQLQGSLGADHIGVITRFYKRGRGLFLWGDNDPYHVEANQLAQPLFGVTLAGGDMADQTVGVRRNGQGPGVVPDHLLTTGIEQLYEGITVSSLQGGQLRPLIFGSFGGTVAGFHDDKGRRAIVDGGFTRLYHKWDTAGTARYVTNAAAWLANTERFGQR